MTAMHMLMKALNDGLETYISAVDIVQDMNKNNKDKASGIDQIPVQVLCNDNCIIHVLSYYDMAKYISIDDAVRL